MGKIRGNISFAGRLAGFDATLPSLLRIKRTPLVVMASKLDVNSAIVEVAKTSCKQREWHGALLSPSGQVVLYPRRHDVACGLSPRFECLRIPQYFFYNWAKNPPLQPHYAEKDD